MNFYINEFDRVVIVFYEYEAALGVGIVRYNLLMLGDHRIPIPKNQFAAVQELVREHFFKRK